MLPRLNYIFLNFSPVEFWTFVWRFLHFVITSLFNACHPPRLWVFKGRYFSSLCYSLLFWPRSYDNNWDILLYYCSITVLDSHLGVSNLWPTGHMQPRMAVNMAQHKIIILLKTLWDYFVIMCHNVFSVWPKIILFLPLWFRDAKRLDTPVRSSKLFVSVFSLLINSPRVILLGRASRKTWYFSQNIKTLPCAYQS